MRAGASGGVLLIEASPFSKDRTESGEDLESVLLENVDLKYDMGQLPSKR